MWSARCLARRSPLVAWRSHLLRPERVGVTVHGIRRGMVYRDPDLIMMSPRLRDRWGIGGPEYKGQANPDEGWSFSPLTQAEKELVRSLPPEQVTRFQPLPDKSWWVNPATAPKHNDPYPFPVWRMRCQDMLHIPKPGDPPPRVMKPARDYFWGLKSWRDKLEFAFRNYGWYMIPSYFYVYFSTLFGLWAAMLIGVLPMKFALHLIAEYNLHEYFNRGTMPGHRDFFMVAWMFTKMLEPVRLVATIYCIPRMSRVFWQYRLQTAVRTGRILKTPVRT